MNVGDAVGAVLVAILGTVATAMPLAAHEIAASRYNYRDDVRPLFVEHCGGCHHAGGPSPMSLLDYQEAVPWANAIKLQVLQQHMPPFLPDDANGPFLHPRGLTADEIDIIVDWTVGATPEGDPIDSSESGSRSEPEGTAPKREPDVVLEPAESVVVAADESEKTACVVLPTGIDRARVLSRLELLPGAASVLRRATISLGDSCSRGEPVLTWLPDEAVSGFPDGLGRELPPKAMLAIELRYKKGWGQEGKRITDKTAVRLWFSAVATPVATTRIDRQEALRGATRLVGLLPDVSGSSAEAEPLRVEAVLPGGKTRLLLSVASLDPAWVEKYFFREPVTLPSGTEIRTSGPAVWADFVSVGSSGANEDASGTESSR